MGGGWLLSLKAPKALIYHNMWLSSTHKSTLILMVCIVITQCLRVANSVCQTDCSLMHYTQYVVPTICSCCIQLLAAVV